VPDGAGAGERTLPLACSIDEAYTLPLLVALWSLRACLGPDRRVFLHLIHTGLPDPHLEAIARLVDLSPIRVPRSALGAIPSHQRFPPEAAAPILLGRLLPPHLDRVVFLDADVLVLDDPAELWGADLGSCPLGAVVDQAIPRCSAPRGVREWRRHGIPPEAPYFNAGVMAVSLGAWRERRVAERALAYLARRKPRGSFLHQEALNAALCGDWAPLDARWNLVASLAGRAYGAPLGEDRPGIVHFAGRFKPWRGRVAGPFDDAYRAVLEEVEAIAGPAPRRLAGRLLSAYDRRLRDVLYPLERALWARGVV
jgi:lipopolysaccharide biosynthesis glycosyltransferase